MILCVFANAQKIMLPKDIDPKAIDALELRDEHTHVSAVGEEVPGVDLGSYGDPVFHLGDDPSFAVRDLVDSTWISPDSLRDLPNDTARVHWVRYTLAIDEDLVAVPLLLMVGSSSPVEVFLNGRSVLRSDPRSVTKGSAVQEEHLHPFILPVAFHLDGAMDVIAIRVVTEGTDKGPWTPPEVSLHAADTAFLVQRTLLHFGLFLGVNSIIFILALVLWSLDRRERSWALLAWMSLITAVLVFCDIGVDRGLLGVPEESLVYWQFVDAILFAWPTYLLIMVLWGIRGNMSRRRAVVYTSAAIIISICRIGFLTAQMTFKYNGAGDFIMDASVAEDAVPLLLAFAVGGILFSISLTIFAVEVIRMGFHVVRTKGYGRWIGAGAIFSSLVSVLLGAYSGMADMASTSWLNTLSDYCEYLAIPVSIAIYLAIRSAHNNKLVARQRDELDLEVQERTAELRQERDRSDELLLNILPHEVAQELKMTGAAAAKHFDLASVLFTDFKGFTTMSERVGPAELLTELNTCFKAFDDIIGARGIEKIKTIGDAYMCVGGLPDPKTSSPSDVVHAALEMQAFMIARKRENDALGKPAFEMRLVIQTGPVVAGIVGVKKFQYDIWGDTVNTASRMESSGEVRHVNISGTTYELVKGDPGLTFTPRGKVQAKGKGEMEMYYVYKAV